MAPMTSEARVTEAHLLDGTQAPPAILHGIEGVVFHACRNVDVPCQQWTPMPVNMSVRSEPSRVQQSPTCRADAPRQAGPTTAGQAAARTGPRMRRAFDQALLLAGA